MDNDTDLALRYTVERARSEHRMRTEQHVLDTTLRHKVLAHEADEFVRQAVFERGEGYRRQFLQDTETTARVMRTRQAYSDLALEMLRLEAAWQLDPAQMSAQERERAEANHMTVHGQCTPIPTPDTERLRTLYRFQVAQSDPLRYALTNAVRETVRRGPLLLEAQAYQSRRLAEMLDMADARSRLALKGTVFNLVGSGVGGVPAQQQQQQPTSSVLQQQAVPLSGRRRWINPDDPRATRATHSEPRGGNLGDWRPPFETEGLDANMRRFLVKNHDTAMANAWLAELHYRYQLADWKQQQQPDPPPRRIMKWKPGHMDKFHKFLPHGIVWGKEEDESVFGWAYRYDIPPAASKPQPPGLETRAPPKMPDSTSARDDESYDATLNTHPYTFYKRAAVGGSRSALFKYAYLMWRDEIATGDPTHDTERRNELETVWHLSNMGTSYLVTHDVDEEALAAVIGDHPISPETFDGLFLDEATAMFSLDTSYYRTDARYTGSVKPMIRKKKLSTYYNLVGEWYANWLYAPNSWGRRIVGHFFQGAAEAIGLGLLGALATQGPSMVAIMDKLFNTATAEGAIGALVTNVVFTQALRFFSANVMAKAMKVWRTGHGSGQPGKWGPWARLGTLAAPVLPSVVWAGLWGGSGSKYFDMPWHPALWQVLDPDVWQKGRRGRDEIDPGNYSSVFPPPPQQQQQQTTTPEPAAPHSPEMRSTPALVAAARQFVYKLRDHKTDYVAGATSVLSPLARLDHIIKFHKILDFHRVLSDRAYIERQCSGGVSDFVDGTPHVGTHLLRNILPTGETLPAEASERKAYLVDRFVKSLPTGPEFKTTTPQDVAMFDMFASDELKSIANDARLFVRDGDPRAAAATATLDSTDPTLQALSVMEASVASESGFWYKGVNLVHERIKFDTVEQCRSLTAMHLGTISSLDKFMDPAGENPTADIDFTNACTWLLAMNDTSDAARQQPPLPPMPAPPPRPAAPAPPPPPKAESTAAAAAAEAGTFVLDPMLALFRKSPWGQSRVTTWSLLYDLLPGQQQLAWDSWLAAAMRYPGSPGYNLMRSMQSLNYAFPLLDAAHLYHTNKGGWINGWSVPLDSLARNLTDQSSALSDYLLTADLVSCVASSVVSYLRLDGGIVDFVAFAAAWSAFSAIYRGLLRSFLANWSPEVVQLQIDTMRAAHFHNTAATKPYWVAQRLLSYTMYQTVRFLRWVLRALFHYPIFVWTPMSAIVSYILNNLPAWLGVGIPISETFKTQTWGDMLSAGWNKLDLFALTSIFDAIGAAVLSTTQRWVIIGLVVFLWILRWTKRIPILRWRLPASWISWHDWIWRQLMPIPVVADLVANIWSTLSSMVKWLETALRAHALTQQTAVPPAGPMAEAMWESIAPDIGERDARFLVRSRETRVSDDGLVHIPSSSVMRLDATAMQKQEPQSTGGGGRVLARLGSRASALSSSSSSSRPISVLALAPVWHTDRTQQYLRLLPLPPSSQPEEEEEEDNAENMVARDIDRAWTLPLDVPMQRALTVRGHWTF